MVDFELGINRMVKIGSDLTPRQLALLMHCRKGPCTVRAVANELNISKPAITRAADKLADQNYIGRKDDPADRRSVLLVLTKDGQKFIESILKA